MKDIKIFVSHRIDQDSFRIDNPLYYNIRCGAIFDKRENIDMLGDNTGDNISEKRDSFCELTVQYWAWKNMDADYYGLCHYRRYFSFSDEKFGINENGQIEGYTLSPRSAERFNLHNCALMAETIQNTDAIFMESYNIINKATPIGNRGTVISHWQAWDKHLIDKNVLDIMKTIIELKYPKYYDSFISYINGSMYIGYNCFIMKKALFRELCEFQFGVLFELEKRIDNSYYHETMLRTIGFMGEILLATFEKYLNNQPDVCIEYKQLVFFNYSLAEKDIKPAFNENNVPVVFMSSNYYVPYLSVCIDSLIDHIDKKKNYDIIILEKEITESNKDILYNMLKSKRNVSIRFINPAIRISGAKFHISHEVYAEEAYYRLLVPWILNNYDKAIVMDCDIVIKKDIADLYSIDIQDNLVGGVKDVIFQGILNGTVPGTYEYCKNEMGMKNPYEYVNTGVLIMNLEKWRTEFKEEGIIKYATEKKFRIQEQDILNVLFEEQVFFIEPRWNYFIGVNDFIKNSLNWAPHQSKKYFDSFRDTAYFIHYAAVPKPWNQPEIDYANEFWFYARNSIFYETILSRMMDKKLGLLHPAVFDLQNRAGVFDHRSTIRKAADKFLPVGSKRRELLKILVPKGSHRWNFLQKIYSYILKKIGTTS